ncbi:MAG: rhomboid family intramembrane serine protease [Candidatus Hadarchaeota archaeon]
MKARLKHQLTSILRVIKSIPMATLILTAANVIVFLLLESGGLLSQAAQDYGFRPAALARGEAIPSVLASVFIHVNLVHLLGNVVSLLAFGFILEKKIGFRRFVFIYFATHVMALLLTTAISPGYDVPMVGASAAISGIIGAAYLAYPWQTGPLGYLIILIWPIIALFLPGWAAISTIITTYLVVFLILFLIPVPIWPFSLAYLAYQLLKGFEGVEVAQGVVVLKGVGYWAHITGFLAGMVFISFLKPGMKEPELVEKFLEGGESTLKQRVHRFFRKLLRRETPEKNKE